ncbi:membrane-associated Zn-dependent protease 1 [Xenorhabdus hominickii]|uniref:Membrane-associated Zn-dependent protease 1 n=1 Tax=Xenorhabdus hominickii TaxID=351679 RepID=A0A2G0Q8U8_XENHO|nr:membrane-associated Zn-dependent protease 1 [Xenorhabdus hominickii]AOM41108.1 membrane-associated Zn-dependent protease 1 [Xenorhabdus hominickii]PHM55654.1 membrane-associated Zn-dependent protease 1 [Xenorhabdus hominickii]
MKWRGYTCSVMLLASSLFTPALWAKGEAHLLFHMGLGASGKFFVGGTLQNKGDQPVASGYLVVLPLNAKCEPEKLSVQSFDSLAPGEKKEFRVPIDTPLSGYRLIGFGAYDDMGFTLPTIDETAKIIQEREPDERKACQSARSKTTAENKVESPK